MKLIKRISCFFDRISHEIRMIKIKYMLIFALIFLILGIASWIIGGGVNRVMLLYTFPRSAIHIGFMFILWGLSFLLCGTIFAGVLFGCEKYKRQKAYKIGLYIALMQIFTLIIYPLFFGAIAPFIALLSILVSIFLCFLAIISAYRIYSMWTICLGLHFLWLLYNGYICLAFILIN